MNLKKFKSLFPLYSAGSASTENGMCGPTLEIPHGGILIRLFLNRDDWVVLVPDFDGMSEFWRPGMMIPTKTVPLVDFLKSLRETYVKEH